MSPDPQPADDLRKLEARMDARLGAVNGRFATVDRRHDSVSSRLDTMEDQWQVFGEQVDRRIETHDDRFVATDRRIDIVHDRLAGKIDELAKEVERQARVVLYAAGGTTAAVVAVGLAVLAVLS